MKYFDSHFVRVAKGEFGFVFGVIGGRVHFEPDARWLYSVRLLIGLWKAEILWTTGENWK